MHGKEPAEADRQSFVNGESSILFSNLVLLENNVTKKEMKQILAKNDQQERDLRNAQSPSSGYITGEIKPDAYIWSICSGFFEFRTRIFLFLVGSPGGVETSNSPDRNLIQGWIDS